ncbi:MAG: class I tRNA ligase family protein, partial [Candidatus Coatesbacteria bacterium]|nr:class I tRNA ligase family protein [Candidatus Coatesbacteria bacterium]
IGISRFLQKVWGLVQKHLEFQQKGQEAPVLGDDDLHALHSTIKRVRFDLENYHFNTALAALMELQTTIAKSDAFKSQDAVEKLILLLAPLAPHLSEELWEQLGHSESIFDAEFPEFDAELTKAKMITVPIQINGKIRAKLDVESDISESDILEMALSDSNVQKHIEGKTVRHQQYVKGRIITIAVG